MITINIPNAYFMYGLIITFFGMGSLFWIGAFINKSGYEAERQGYFVIGLIFIICAIFSLIGQFNLIEVNFT